MSTEDTKEEPIKQFLLKGVVRDGNNGPRADVVVRAYDKDLRKQQKLGETRTDKQGRYAISYSQNQFCRAEKGKADIFIIVSDTDDQELKRSDIVYNAPDEAVIDIVVGNGSKPLSEFEQIKQAIEPIRKDQGENGETITFTELNNDDIKFITNETGISADKISALIEATKSVEMCARNTTPQFASHLSSSAIPVEAFYGWFRRGLPTEWDMLVSQSAALLKRALLSAVKENIVPQWLEEKTDQIVESLPSPHRRDVADLGLAAGLPDSVMNQLAGRLDKVELIDDKLLSRLVSEKTMTDEDAKKLGLGLSLQRLTGFDSRAVATLRDLLPKDGEKAMRSAAGLARFDRTDWSRLLEKANVGHVEGSSIPELASKLEANVARAFPKVAFEFRAARQPAGIEQHFERLHSDADAAAMKEAEEAVTKLINLHPGLALEEAIKKAETPAAAAAKVRERIGWIRNLFDKNPSVDFLTADLTPDSADLQNLEFDGLDDESKSMVLADIKAQQRINAVTNNVLTSTTLMEAGLHSAAAITRVEEPDLEKIGLSKSEAQAIVTQSAEINENASLLWFGVYTLARDQQITPIRMLPSEHDFFTKLPGYAELFGEQSFCHCEHCQSILSPAAYFVDLMRYIEGNILKWSFVGKEKDPLHLQVRRPDLWKLLLTCDNTTKYVPYLDIINEVLEAYILLPEPPYPKESKRHFTDIATFYHELSEADDSLKQPFHWPAERLAAYLPHFQVSRFDIAKLMNAKPDVLVRARLGLTPKDYEIITRARIDPTTDASYFERLFGVTNVSQKSADDTLAPQNLQLLLDTTGLSREACESILKSSFVNEDGSTNPKIKILPVASNRAANPQNDVELVEQLSLHRLDRINRLIRLWRRLPWTVAELDAVLTSLKASDVPSDNVKALGGMFDMLVAQDMISAGVDELLAMGGDVPTKPLRENLSLFDRLFNPELFAPDKSWPPASETRYVHPALNKANPGVSLPDAQASHRLLSALQVSDRDLADLIQELLLPLSGAQPPNDNGFELTAKNLALLYRHARAARFLGVSAKNLFSLIQLTPEISAPSNNDTVKRILSVSDLLAVLRLQRWQKGCGFDVEEIEYLVGGGSQQDQAFLIPANTARQLLAPDTMSAVTSNEVGAEIIDDTVVDRLSTDIVVPTLTDQSLEFADTVFTQIGLSEKDSQKIVADNLQTQNPAFVKGSTADSYRVTDGFDPLFGVAGLVIDASIKQADARDKIGKVLRNYTSWTVLTSRLAAKLTLLPDRLEGLLSLLRSDMTPQDVKEVIRSLKGDPSKTALKKLLRRVLRYAVLLKSPVFTSTTLQYIATQKPTFGLKGLLAIQTIQRVVTYIQLATPPDRSFTGAGADPDITALHVSIDTITAGLPKTQQEIEMALEKIAAALRVDKALVIPLWPSLATLPPNALECLAAIREVLDLSGKLGLNGETFRLIASDDYDELNRGADGVLAAFRTKYPDEKTFLDKIDPFDDKLRGRKRDALVDYMTTEWRVHFSSPRSLYEYFLLDVELGGCARTSRIVAATSSLQLYVQRVLMNLEQSEDGEVHASFGDVKEPKVQEAIAEWTWRKQYRVWEANRKVFLYPENYIEPELRDDKSHLFKELEDALLQQQITEQAILDDYAKYLAGFEELANLTIAGAHLEYIPSDPSDPQSTPISRLHVFGASSSDPPTFYYRVVDALDSSRPIFGNWSKVNVQIPVRKVSPIIYLGQLYVFWVTITTRSQTTFDKGDSRFIGYTHKISVFYSALRLDNTWSPPQRLFIRYDPDSKSTVATAIEVTVPDPLLDDGDIQNLPAVDSKGYQLTLTVPNITTKAFIPRYDKVIHYSPVEGYTLRGDQWELVYPSVRGDELLLTLRNFRMTGVVEIGLNRFSVTDPKYRARIVDLLRVADDKVNLQPAVTIFHDHHDPSGTLPIIPSYHTSLGVRNALLDERISNFAMQDDAGIAPEINESIRKLFDGYSLDESKPIPVFTVAPELNPKLVAIDNSSTAALLAFNGNDFYLLYQVLAPHTYRLHRLGTSTSDRLRSSLGKGGVSGLISLATQRDLYETPWVLPSSESGTLLVGGSRDPFVGAYGNYMGEIFFQLPFLIANHLNSQQMFAASQHWYHYIFDPTATDNPPRIVYDSDNKELIIPAKPDDRPWRYLGFRNLNSVGLRDVLQDHEALAAYKNDPFNPHAIARVRPCAYQKSIVMKYIDNLLDWGDQLFTQFTMESINEATMLYVMASDILGPRPAEIGDCTESNDGERTYDKIAPQLDEAEEFLIELEALAAPVKQKTASEEYVVEFPRPKNAFLDAPVEGGVVSSAQPMVEATASATESSSVTPNWNKATAVYWSGTDGTALSNLYSHETSGSAAVGTGALAAPSTSTVIPTRDERVSDAKILDFTKSNGQYGNGGKPQRKWQSAELVSKLVFCIPDNKELRAYWDRVEDRLSKIRNCMDIAGVRRRLELFSPEIDPRLLVRLKAAGLSIEDVLQTTSGDVPPYRFAYLIEKAKQYAATVQGFGSQLLSAIEKRDAEELNRLRIVHEQNLLKQRREAMEWEVNAADDAVESLRRQKTTVEYRRDYYSDLAQKGLSEGERIQQESTRLASAIHVFESTMAFLGVTLGLFPNVGSPFAMTYGGRELKSSSERFAAGVKATASAASAIAQSAEIGARFQRRQEDWNHQIELARRDLLQVEKQISAAEFRQEIAKRSFEVHQKTIDQTEEVFNLYRDHFSNLGRFTWLSTQLHRLYRMTFNSAFSMATLAEQAYRFERDDDVSSPLLGGSYWNTENAGLLAGDQLLLDLQNLERRYLETNYRTLEIEQSFSLSQFAPLALLNLRQTAECEFTIPEVFFDLTYPGHYRRRIKAVRLTIPCICGPYTNIGATLRLTESSIRLKPESGKASPVPASHTSTIATSTAQNDAGVFEFGFRDERYMPFEGAGTISKWKLTLPKNFTSFDYQTISDVILRISYTAEEDDDWRRDVENQNGALQESIQKYLSVTGLPLLFSLRHEFPDVWHRLVSSPVATVITLEVSDRHLPYLFTGLQQRNMQLEKSATDILLQTDSEPTVKIKMNGTTLTAWAKENEGLYKGIAGNVEILGKHTLEITSSGNVGAGGVSTGAIDTSKLTDIFLSMVIKI